MSVSAECQAWIAANYDWPAYNTARIELGNLRLARPRAPLARLAPGHPSGGLYWRDQWDAYLVATVDWIDRVGAAIATAAAHLNMPAYWLTQKVPPIRVGTLTLYPQWMTKWLIRHGTEKPNRDFLLRLWRDAGELPRGEGGISIAGAFYPVPAWCWTVTSHGEMGIPMVYSDPFHSQGSVTAPRRLCYPNAVQLSEMVEAMLRFVEATPAETAIKYAGETFSRIANEQIARLHPSKAVEVKMAASGVMAAAGTALALIPGGQAYAAILGAMALALELLPIAVAERTWCGPLEPSGAFPHYTLCHLDYPPRVARGGPLIPDPYLAPPPLACGGTEAATGVWVPSALDLFPGRSASPPPVKKKKPSSSSKGLVYTAVGLSLLAAAALVVVGARSST